MRRQLRALSTVLIISGALLLSDAALTVAWQEPVSALYAQIVQGRLGDDLRKLELAKPSARDLAALRSLENDRRADGVPRARAAAHRQARRGRRAHPDPADRRELRRRQGNRRRRRCARAPGSTTASPFPGAPGTVAIAGHRTTYLAPFRRIDKLKPGDELVRRDALWALHLPRAAAQDRRADEAVEVVKRVGYDRLVLSACHPLYSAAKRIIVFARFVRAEPRGLALTS